ncbi:MAG: nitrogenase component 1 [Spirochaetaceae bacterium]|jgi:nitrogenase molybdenum-iron protein alpha/beta subunit|nr:nitrogenase component 1 [Spirochaetaceae bacterium]
MSHILFDLPPLSPDYSGVASVFHDLGALTILHDASGCTGTYTGYDEPRWFGSSSPTFCSGLREMDAIMGDDDKLLEKIKVAAREIRPPCVNIVGSPVPMVIGFDFKGFASLVERETGIPAFGFSADGLHYYDQGQRDAYLAIVSRLLETSPRKIKGINTAGQALHQKQIRDLRPPAAASVASRGVLSPSFPHSLDHARASTVAISLRSSIKRAVNILGASALDGFDGAALDALEEMLVDGGFTRLAVWGERSPWEELKESAAAELNWVVSAAALPLARFFEECFGTPFVAGLPVGREEHDRIFSTLNTCCGGEKPARQFPPVPAVLNQKPETMIIGEALFCSSLRAFLEAEGASGPTGISIGTFFTQGRDFLRPGDHLFAHEDDAREALSNPHLKRVFADPLVEALVPEGVRIRFTPLPHRAISGRLYNESLARFFSVSPCLETA